MDGWILKVTCHFNFYYTKYRSKIKVLKKKLEKYLNLPPNSRQTSTIRNRSSKEGTSIASSFSLIKVSRFNPSQYIYVYVTSLLNFERVSVVGSNANCGVGPNLIALSLRLIDSNNRVSERYLGRFIATSLLFYDLFHKVKEKVI